MVCYSVLHSNMATFLYPLLVFANRRCVIWPLDEFVSYTKREQYLIETQHISFSSESDHICVDGPEGYSYTRNITVVWIEASLILRILRCRTDARAWMFCFMSVLSNFERLTTTLRNHNLNAYRMKTYRVQCMGTCTLMTLLQRPYGGVPSV